MVQPQSTVLSLGADPSSLRKKEQELALTPDQARTQAMKHLADVKLGGDPASARDRRKVSPTMKEFAKRFLDDHVAVHCKPSTHGEYKRSSSWQSIQSSARIACSTLAAPTSSACTPQ